MREPYTLNQISCIGLLLLAAAGQPAPASLGHPATYVDEEACPFECCAYKQWTVDQATPAFIRPDRSSPMAGSFDPGQTVVGITGRVETHRPGKVRVEKTYLSEVSRRAYQPGDILWVYTYLGEGYFKVWHQGQMFEEEVAFVLHGDGGWIGCVEDDSCWGRTIEAPNSTWWVKVRSPDGWEGWSDRAENFGDKDTCG